MNVTTGKRENMQIITFCFHFSVVLFNMLKYIRLLKLQKYKVSWSLLFYFYILNQLQFVKRYHSLPCHFILDSFIFPISLQLFSWSYALYVFAKHTYYNHQKICMPFFRQSSVASDKKKMFSKLYYSPYMYSFIKCFMYVMLIVI